MDHDTLILIWFLLIGVLLAGYAILDGFDLGVGILHPLARDDRERRTLMNAIGPLWDGNEVWLVTFGGALFAAFPVAYKSIFSGFYDAFMLLLFALIFRAVSMEFRSKRPGRRWRAGWDIGFFGSSFLATLLFGVAVGNAMVGIPLNEEYNYTGGLPGLLRPYPILTGLLTVAMFAMHGALYLVLKTEGDLRRRVMQWAWRGFGIFMALYMLTTIYTLGTIERATANFEHMPWAAAIVVLNVLAIANIPRCLHGGNYGQAFLSSCATIAALVGLFSIALFPNLVTSTTEADSLTIYNAASSEKTLWIMLIIAMLGLPFVLAYTAAIYWTFRGKVVIDDHSY